MKLADRLGIYKNVALRPITATKMLYRHRRTLWYLLRQKRYRNLYNHVFVTYFVRGEDCGKGVLDPLWKLSGNAPFLWDLEMEVSTRCSLKCIHCEHTHWKDKTYLNQDLKYSDFKRVINGTSNLHWINLTGEGMANLNPQFMRMLRLCKQKGIYVDFSHDFVHMTDEDAQYLIRRGVDRIYWSFDGTTKETYEKIRVGADFDKVCGNVQRLLYWKEKAGSPLPEICFRFCFFNENVHEVSSIPLFLHSLSPDVSLYGDEPSINIVALLEFEETRDWAVEILKGAVELTDSRSEALGFTNYWSHITHIEEEKAPMDYCTFWSEPYIMITGHVVPCCAVMMSNTRAELERLSFGNIKDNTLREIWNSEYYRDFRKAVVNPKSKVPEVCLGCRAFNTATRAKKYGVWRR